MDSLESAIHIREHVSFPISEGGVQLVFDALMERPNDVFHELRRARVSAHHRLTLRRAEFGVVNPQYIHFHAGSHEGNHGMHVPGDAWCVCSAMSVQTVSNFW